TVYTKTDFKEQVFEEVEKNTIVQKQIAFRNHISQNRIFTDLVYMNENYNRENDTENDIYILNHSLQEYAKIENDTSAYTSALNLLATRMNWKTKETLYLPSD